MINIFTQLKKHWLIVTVVIIVVLVGVYFFWFNGNKQTNGILVVKPADFAQTVSVSGKVTSAEGVDLGFNRSGKITAVNAVVGQKVGAGDIIAQLDARGAALDLENARVALAKLVKPAEKVDVIQAQNALQTAKEAKAKAYVDGFNYIDSAFLDLPRIMSGLDSLFNNSLTSPYFSDINLISNQTARNYRQTALNDYYRALDAYNKNLVDQRAISRNSASSLIESLIEETYQTSKLTAEALKNANTAVAFVVNQTDNRDRTTAMITDIANLSSWTNQITVDASNLNLVNDNLSEANRTIANKSEALTKLLTGAEALDIEAEQLAVAQKEHDYQDYFLRAPLAGIVTKLDPKVGEFVTAGTPVVSMINSGLFEIESFVPEINIANLAVGNPAEVTLDAYGAGTVFSAKIISIDPAETIHDGVSTYKVKLQFSAEDSRLKSGMTANLFITSLKKSNVLAIPASAIFTKNGQQFVKLSINNKITDRAVTTGNIGALGQTEITSGLASGDQVILNPSAN